MATNAKQGGKNRKYGRNEQYCKLYTAAGLYEKNQKRRLRRHLLSHPNDTQAAQFFEKTCNVLPSTIRVTPVKGKPTDKTMTAKAARKIRRKGDVALQKAWRERRDARRHARRIAAEKASNAAKPPVQVTAT